MPRRTSPTVAIIGAGVGGIAMGVKLRKAGIHTFRIFEAEAGLGGTWRVNTYPGASVDVESAIYSFSFHDHNWPGTHADQSELLHYLEDAARAQGLTAHFRFGTKIEEVRWLEERQGYLIHTDRGEELTFDVVVSAVGFLSDPSIPDLEGLADFRGPKFHTAQWDHAVDLTGKRVAIVGTGSTSVQIVPAIAPIVDHVYVFQREPGWILPRRDRKYTAEELRKFSKRINRRLRRWRLFIRMEWGYIGHPVYEEGSRRNRHARARSLRYIDSVFHAREDLRKAVTPTYAFSGKRRVLSDDFYPALLAKNVELVPRAVTRITPYGVVDATGQEHKTDVLVLATGFKAAQYLSRLKVFGREGRDLHQVWRDGAFALLGMSLNGFPNFYMLYGPNTNGAGGPITWNSEQQAGWVARDVLRMKRRGYTSIETKASYVTRYNEWLQARLARTAWVSSKNYMKAPSGRIVTQFHGGMMLEWTLLRLLRLPSSSGRVGPARS
jgi:cation diffusion facilitator CzcD-associated flavoprotein CzcO